MTNLDSILNAADKAAVAEANFQKLDKALGGSASGATFRIKDGQIQLWDAAYALADATKPWCAITSNNGVLSTSAPIAD